MFKALMIKIKEKQRRNDLLNSRNRLLKELLEKKYLKYNKYQL